MHRYHTSDVCFPFHTKTLCGAQEQGVTPLGPTTPSCGPDSCPKEIILRARRDSEAAVPEQDKDPRVQDNPEYEERGPEGTRDSRSAFRPLRDNGDPLPLAPRPEPLKRDLHAQRSQPCRMRPCRKRNVISSSYSSTGGFLWLKRRRGPDSSQCHVTLSSSETVSEDNAQAVSQALTHTQGKRAADATPREKLPLLPHRREGPLMLRPPLKLGFRVTAEDLDLEKEAALRSIDSALREPSRPSRALSLPATGTSPPAVPKAPSMVAQQETHKSQDSLGRVSLLASAAGAPSLPAVSGRKCRSAQPLPEEDKHPSVQNNPEGEERGPEGTRVSRSAFMPLWDNGDPLPLVPRPEPPQRDLHAQRSQPCRMRPCRKRNAISMSQDNAQAVSQALIHTQGEKAADATPGEKLAPGMAPHLRPLGLIEKFPLLPRRQGRPLMLPPPLKLGFRVTAEDLDLEKEAALRSIDSALRAKAIWDCRASRPSRALSLPATGTSPPAVPKAPSMVAQQETHKSQDSLGRVSLLASAAGAPSLPAVSGRKCRSAQPLPEEDKHPRVQNNPEGEERGPEGTRVSRSAFMPLWDNGDPLPLVPRPEPPQRDLHAQRSQPCRMRPCRKRNAISSSKSSTGGFPWLKRRRGPDSSHCHVTLSSSETVSQDNAQAVSQALIHTQGEKAADATPGEKLDPRNGSPTSQASRPHRRKFSLLPRRQGRPLMLPPPLKLGFRVTAEDLDLEKEAALRSIDSALRGHLGLQSLTAFRALSLPATGTSPPAVPKAPSMVAQQETHKSQDSLGCVSLLASAAGAPSLPAVSGRKCRSAQPLPEEDKHPRVQNNPEGEERGPEGTRDSRSAFMPLWDNGDPLPLVSRPEPPQRDLHAQRSQPCRMRPCRKRNAISSSYSSTGGFPWLKRRRGPDSSHCHRVSEDNAQAVSQALIHTQGEKAADATPGEKLAPRNGSPTSQASRPHRRKFPLLPCRQGGPLMLPPPLKLGFRVTAEDLDLEKEAALRSIDSALRGEAKAIWDCRASRPSRALSLPATETSPPAVPKALSMDAQQETNKSQDSLGRVSLLASAAGAPSLPAVSGRKCHSAGPLLSSDPLLATSSHSRDTAQVTSLIPATFPAPSVDCSLRSPRPGASAAAATTGPLPPLQGTPRLGPHRMEGKEAPHIPEPQPQLQQVPSLPFLPLPAAKG
ncbi:LOW QUALITY PROTEIN: POM121-like protein 1-like [Plecturocebus cupreus]